MRELVERGVTRAVAAELVATFPEDRIRVQIERFDWLRERRPSKVKDPGAYLADAIRKDYAAPAGFEGRAGRERPGQAGRGESEARSAKVREQQDQARVEAYWASLTPDGQAQLDADALADAERRSEYDGLPSRLKRAYLKRLREEYIRRLLDLPMPVAG